MAASIHAFFKSIIGFFAVLQGASASSSAPRAEIVSRSETLTMSAFITQLRQNAALRARFARNPRGVLREHGIDPTPFNLADRLDPAQLERLLADWPVGADSRLNVAQRSSQPPEPAPQPPPAPVPVYGPPPGLRG